MARPASRIACLWTCGAVCGDGVDAVGRLCVEAEALEVAWLLSAGGGG